MAEHNKKCIRKRGRPTVCWAANVQQHVATSSLAVCEDVQHLENSYQQTSAPPSPEPSVGKASSSAVAGAATTLPGQQAAGAQPAYAAPQRDIRSRLRSAYIRQVLPALRAVRAAEKKLEADFSAVGYAILLMVAVILYDRGWNNLLDRFDESVLGDLCCILVGLGIVFGVKFMGWQPKDYFNV